MSPTQLQTLLKSSGSLDKLKTALKSASSNQFANEDEGFWRPTTDKAGNAFAIIRFMPALPPEMVPFVSYYRHSFQGPNGWYIEKSRTSLGEQDPLAEFNSRLWNTKDATLQDQVRKQSRKLVYVSCIYVVSDKAAPENDGKIFLFRYGKKIFEKISKAANPDFPDDVPPFDPFHLMEGANFKLRQKKQANFPNYDDSAFDVCTPFLGGDEKAISQVLNDMKPLQPLVDPSQFKSYDDLKKKLDKVMGFDTAQYLTPTDAPAAPRATAPKADLKGAQERAERPAATQYVPPTISTEAGDDDVDLSKWDDD